MTLRARQAVWGLVALLGVAGCSSGEGGGVAPETTRATERPVVYGADDRVDGWEVGDPMWSSLVQESAVVLVQAEKLDMTDPEAIRVVGPRLGDVYGLCADQRFIDQPTGGDCSGTLISPELVVTAGHCIDAGSCAGTRLVFDYRYDAEGALAGIGSADVYACAEVVARAEAGDLDFAVVRLDRPVVGRVPAPLRAEDSPLSIGEAVTLIGFPSGLPVKYAPGGAVVNPGGGAVELFTATVDAFGGNSGSGVFNAAGEQVGILVRGAQDYVQRGNCTVVNTLGEEGEEGEGVVYIGRALEALCQASPNEAVCGTVGGGYCFDCANDATCKPGWRCAPVASDGASGTCAPPCGGAADCRAGHSCIEGACLPDAALACSGGDVWQVDSCGRQLGLQEDCAPDAACQGGACVPRPSADTCEDAEVIEARSQVIRGTLVGGYANDLTGSCAGDGPDRVLEFTVAQPVPFTAQATGFDTALHLRRSCEDAASEIACNDDADPPGGLGSRLEAELEPGTYTLVLDAWDDAVAPYELTLTFGEFCANACEAGAQRCNGQQIERCRVNAQGCTSWVGSAACPDGMPCEQGICKNVPAGDSCAAPTVIAATDAVFVGNLADGYTNTTSGSCGGAGPERVYALDVAQPSHLLAEAVGGQAPVLYLRATCDQGASELGCGVANWPTAPSAVVEADLAPGRYYLFMDMDRDIGAYQMGLTLTPICPTQCMSGEVRCGAGGVERCVVDANGCRYFGDLQACDADEACVGGVCQDACGDGCDVGTTRCQGAQVQACQVGGGGCQVWGAASSCPAGQSCVDGACSRACEDACTLGARRCASNGRPDVCRLGASGCTEWRLTSCAAGYTCAAGQCVQSCTDVCELGDRRCFGSAEQGCVVGAQGCGDWGAPAACDADEICVDGSCLPTCVAECTPGERSCQAGGAVVCQSEPNGCHRFSAPVACGGSEVCLDGRCVASCTSACTVGARECSGAGFRVCQSQPSGCSVWSSVTACLGGEVCGAGGFCQTTCDSACTPGTTQCSGDAVQVCLASADGCHQWGAPAACPGGFSCTGGVCEESCEAECTPGVQECAGDGVRVCVARPNGCHVWTQVRTCQPDEACVGGVCAPVCVPECAAGESRCLDSGAVQRCEASADGCPQWATSSCDADQTCAGGACVATCEDACDLGAAECVGDGTRACVAGPDGCAVWAPVEACPVDSFCRDGSCAVGCEDSCAPGSRRCDGAGYRECAPSTEGCMDWSSLRFCGEQEVCEAGACVLTCTRECTPGARMCSSATSRAICIEDLQGCTRWSDPVECPESAACEGGVCDLGEDVREEPDPDEGPEPAPVAGGVAAGGSGGCLGCQTGPGRPWEGGLWALGLLAAWSLRRRVR